jgi:phenylacetate-CoA ligase
MIFKLVKYYLSLYYWDKVSLKYVKKMQLKKFREIFEYAKVHSKFYNQLYKDAGVYDLEIKTYKDLEKIPIIDKQILRKYNYEDILTCDINEKLNIHSTSGSTGEPFKIAYSKFEDYTSHIRFTKTIMKYGYNPFKKSVLLSRYAPGHKFEVEDDLNIIKLLQKKLGLFHREVISIFQPTEDIITQLKNIKPFILWSTPSVIHQIALELEKNDTRLDIPLVLLMAETISPFQVELFKRRVCTNFIDAYGCMESPFIGFSFNNNNTKNIISNSTLVEVVNKRIFNEAYVGDVVITSLINKTMPFIRYRIGDFVGIADDEQFPFKKIGKVYGRFDDILNFGDNYSLVFHQTYDMFRGFDECLQYKFIQYTNGAIVLQLKINIDADKEVVKNKALDIWTQKFPDFELNIEFVENFQIDKKTGKFKVIEKLTI